MTTIRAIVSIHFLDLYKYLATSYESSKSKLVLNDDKILNTCKFLQGNMVLVEVFKGGLVLRQGNR